MYLLMYTGLYKEHVRTTRNRCVLSGYIHLQRKGGELTASAFRPLPLTHKNTLSYTQTLTAYESRASTFTLSLPPHWYDNIQFMVIGELKRKPKNENKTEHQHLLVAHPMLVTTQMQSLLSKRAPPFVSTYRSPPQFPSPPW